MGTLAYMSPEQAAGETTDQRTDIWSLGVVFYEMIAGKPPFEGESSSDIIAAILNQQPQREGRRHNERAVLHEAAKDHEQRCDGERGP